MHAASYSQANVYIFVRRICGLLNPNDPNGRLYFIENCRNEFILIFKKNLFK